MLKQLLFQLNDSRFPPELRQQANVQLSTFKMNDNAIKWLQHAVGDNDIHFTFYTIDCYCYFISHRQLPQETLMQLTKHLISLFGLYQFPQPNGNKMKYAISLSFAFIMIQSQVMMNPLELFQLIPPFDVKLEILHELYQLIESLDEMKSSRLRQIMNNSQNLILSELIKTGNFNVIVVLSDCLTYSSTFNKQFLPQLMELIEITLTRNIHVEQGLDLFQTFLIRGLLSFLLMFL